MKGITPVIAIILLLLLTISMVGFAFVWFNRITTEAASTVGNEATQQLDRQTGRVIIDAARGTSTANTVTVRNIGSRNINPYSELAVFFDGTLQTACAWTNNAGVAIDRTVGTIAPNAVATCTVTFADAGLDCSGKTARVTAPGNADEMNCV